MIRGTTPTFTLTINDPDGTVDLTTAENVYVTIKQGDIVLTKSGDDLDVQPTVVSGWLTQDESLGLVAGVPAAVQVNWTYTNVADGSIRRSATKIRSLVIDRQLLPEVLA